MVYHRRTVAFGLEVFENLQAECEPSACSTTYTPISRSRRSRSVRSFLPRATLQTANQPQLISPSSFHTAKSLSQGPASSDIQASRPWHAQDRITAKSCSSTNMVHALVSPDPGILIPADNLLGSQLSDPSSPHFRRITMTSPGHPGDPLRHHLHLTPRPRHSLEPQSSHPLNRCGAYQGAP